MVVPHFFLDIRSFVLYHRTVALYHDSVIKLQKNYYQLLL